MTRSRTALARLLLAAALVAGTAGAQGMPSPAGDAWVDARLSDIGTYATTYRDAFVDELVRYHRAPRELVTELLARPGWTPGDVYFACSLAMQAGRPCRAVAELRQGNPSQDWATIARGLGIAPGTAGYAGLKRGIAASYEHWARPLPPDMAVPAVDAPGTEPAPSAKADVQRRDPHRGRH